MGQIDETCNEKTKIDRVGVTSDKLTSRAGLTFLVHYLEAIDIYSLLERYFGSVRQSAKGIPVKEAFKQLICFFVDGTNLHLSYFDELKKEVGYAKTIETSPSDLASSYQVNRFLQKFSYLRNFLFRRLLQAFFVWRLQVVKPEFILLDLDTMVMDNDTAKKREGVNPTYKKVKGFQPLQLKWGPYFVDAVFRGGSKHSNHGNTVVTMVEHVVEKIRNEYDEEVPIVLTADIGFFDQVNFRAFEELGIGYVVGGKLYSDIEKKAEAATEADWSSLYKEDGRVYKLLSFEDQRGNWNQSRRAIYTRLVDEGHLRPLRFAQHRKLYYTNLGTGEAVNTLLIRAAKLDWLTSGGIVKLAHGRGDDERTHRCLKEFGTEKLPFQDFEPNTAFYYIMVFSLNLEEAFKRDVTKEQIRPVCYPATFKRKFIDVAGKVVRTSGYTALKVTKTIWNRLHVPEVWERVNSPPVIALSAI
jgi:hypothetical protein